MVSTPEVCTNNSLMKHNPSVSSKKHSARKSLRKFTETFNIKHKTAVQRLGADRSKRKETKRIKYCGYAL